MVNYIRSIWARLVSAWAVASGQAVAVPIFDEDTTIIVLETEGSQVNYLSSRSYVSSEDSYNMLLTKIILWTCSNKRYFWSCDQLGSQLKGLAEAYYETHKNKQ